jgi:predicted kinase
VAILFLTCGLPASGKTTLAKRLEREHSALRLTADEWLSEIHPSLPSDELDEFRPVVERIQLRVAERLFTLGCNVVLDWGLYSREERDQYRTLARDLDAGVVLCVVNLPVDEIRNRISRRNAGRRPGDFHISEQNLERALHLWQLPTPEELALFDEMPAPTRPD